MNQEIWRQIKLKESVAKTTLYDTKLIMKRKIIYVSVFLIVAFIAFFRFMQYQADEQRLLAIFNLQLKEEKYEEIYDNSANAAKRGATKEEFVKRMKDAVKKLKDIDSDLNIQYDSEWTHLIASDNQENGDFIQSFQSLDKDGKSVEIGVSWSVEQLRPKLYDFYVLPKNEDSKSYEVVTVTHSLKSVVSSKKKD